jgi:hypothetical protein
MFPDIHEIRNTRKIYNGKMLQSGVKTFRELGEIEANALMDGALDSKYKELVALGISISNACYG